MRTAPGRYGLDDNGIG